MVNTEIFAQQIGVNIRTIRLWWLCFLDGHSLENKMGCPMEMVEHPLKIQMRGMISYQAVSDLHMIDTGPIVTAEYHVNKLLKETLSVTYNENENRSHYPKKDGTACPIPYSSKIVHRRITRKCLKNG